MKKITLLIFLVLLLIFSCTKKEEKGFNVIASSFPSYTLARSIMGSDENLKMLLPPGVDSHNYEPSPKDILEVTDATLIVYTGGDSDQWVEKIINSLDKEINTFRLVANVPSLLEEEEEDEHEHIHNDERYDEHVWTSIENEIILTKALEDKLSEIDPENEALYRENGKNEREELTLLLEDYQRVIKEAKNDTLIFSSRFPFRYLADEFNLDYISAFPSCNEESEPSVKQVATLIDKTKELGLRYILKTEFSSENLSRVISEEANAKVLTLNSMHNIEKDRFKKGDSYISIMRENLEVLKEALN